MFGAWGWRSRRSGRRGVRGRSGILEGRYSGVRGVVVVGG